MPDVTVQDPKLYSAGYNGTALKVIIFKGGASAEGKVNPINIVGRGQNFNYQVATPVTQADEINSRIVKETNHGRQELGSGRIDVVFNLQANDQLPTAQTLGAEQELICLEVTGDDHPATEQDADGNPTPIVLNAFLGMRIVNKASATSVNQQKMLGVDVIFRQHLTGLEYKALNESSPYPATP